MSSYSTEDERLQSLAPETGSRFLMSVFCYSKRRVSSAKRTPCTGLCQGKHSRFYLPLVNLCRVYATMQSVDRISQQNERHSRDRVSLETSS